MTQFRSALNCAPRRIFHFRLGTAEHNDGQSRYSRTLTRELPMGEPPIWFNASSEAHSDSGITKESPVKTPLYPSMYIRSVRPEILPSSRAWIQYLDNWATEEDRHGASPPDVIMATLACLPSMAEWDRRKTLPESRDAMVEYWGALLMKIV
jgi:hypothetical protein